MGVPYHALPLRDYSRPAELGPGELGPGELGPGVLGVKICPYNNCNPVFENLTTPGHCTVIGNKMTGEILFTEKEKALPNFSLSLTTILICPFARPNLNLDFWNCKRNCSEQTLRIILCINKT